MSQTSKNDIDELRTQLFETLRQVRAGTIDLEAARTVNDLSKTIVDTAKVEVDFLRVNGGGESDFLTGTMGKGNLPTGITGVTRHLIK